ncbi:MAG TPA: type II toxin-antitoxin system HicA family toxin [Tepidisphaeraceae bacterium]|nr:type II toxin-antitoxin system HicA family toxin [Tepidisphaeraceae bacterium]
MKLPRDLSGQDLARALAKYGYRVTRQKGSHMRLTTLHLGEHHITIPTHDALRPGTLTGILDMVAAHLEISRQELQSALFE